MKTILSVGIALLALAPAHAQIFRSEAAKGAVLGGIAGGIIGHNSGDLRNNGWKGAAIGATAGLLIGQAIGDARAERDYGRGGGYVYRNEPSVRVGIGYHSGYYGGGYWGRGHGWPRGHYHGRGLSWGISYGPSWSYQRGYGGYPHIGYADYMDYVYRTPSVPVVVQPPQVVQAAPVQQPAAPQQVTIINNYYGNATPMSSANALFGR